MLLARSTASAALLAAVSIEHGMELPAILEGTGIDPVTLEDSDADIQAEQELRLVRNVVAGVGNVPGIGLSAGSRYQLATHGVWALCVLSAPTVRTALHTAIEYIDLGSSFFDWQLRECADGVDIVIDTACVPATIRTFLIERDVACVVAAARGVFDLQQPLTRIELSCPMPDYEELYDRVLGCRPIFGAAATRLTVSPSILNRSMPQANPHAAAMAERQCQDLRRRRRLRTSVAAQVRQLLLACGGSASQQEIAADLRLSVRTMFRRLAEEGTTFRELVDETRHLIAADGLASGESVEVVAARLGYTHVGGFTRAFKRWTGTTPARFCRVSNRHG